MNTNTQVTVTSGPDHNQVAALIALIPSLTVEQLDKANKVWDDNHDVAARAAALHDAQATAKLHGRFPIWVATMGAVKAPWLNVVHAAVLAVIVHNLISQEQFDILWEPIKAAGVNPDTLGVKQ